MLEGDDDAIYVASRPLALRRMSCNLLVSAL
jgi:hypothetical protein